MVRSPNEKSARYCNGMVERLIFHQQRVGTLAAELKLSRQELVARRPVIPFVQQLGDKYTTCKSWAAQMDG